MKYYGADEYRHCLELARRFRSHSRDEQELVSLLMEQRAEAKESMPPIPRTPEPATQEKIVAVACVYQGQVWQLPRPARHCHIIHAISEATCWNPEKRAYDPLPEEGERRMKQGFMTSNGRYVDREEGGRIAIAAGQIEKLRWGDELYSEDLW